MSITRTIPSLFSRSSSGRISPRKRLPGKASVSIWIGPRFSIPREPTRAVSGGSGSRGQELKEGSRPGKESRLLDRRPERRKLDGYAGRDTVEGRAAAARRDAVSTGRAGIAIEHDAKGRTRRRAAECGSPAFEGGASRTPAAVPTGGNGPRRPPRRRGRRRLAG